MAACGADGLVGVDDSGTGYASTPFGVGDNFDGLEAPAGDGGGCEDEDDEEA